MEKPDTAEKNSDPWQDHAVEQMLRFRSLSLRSKMEAVEGMANILRRFEQMRKSGAFKSCQTDLANEQGDE